MVDPSTAAVAPTEPRVLYLSAASGLAEDRSWIFDVRDRFDVVHWHDTVDGLGPDCARRLTETLAAAGKPLVVTLASGTAHPAGMPSGPPDAEDAQDVLVAAADALIVPDERSAELVRTRWHRDATLLAESDDEGCAEVYRSVVAALA